MDIVWDPNNIPISREERWVVLDINGEKYEARLANVGPVMSGLPFVSCLMPTKNRRQFIPAAVEMWISQNCLEDTELIVIEDGDDNISDLLPSGCDISYHRFEGTLGAKLNFGRDVAKGKILINWDDDDWNAPNRISQQVDHMRLTGKPFVAMSSLIFYREGDDFGMEYTADAWYGSGSTHCYTREYALANPRPDKTVGEDNIAVAHAHEIGALSTVSGLACLVARDHDGNCSGRRGKSQIAFLNENPPDNFRPIPLSRFKETVTV